MTRPIPPFIAVILCLLASIAATVATAQETVRYEIEVEAGEHDRVNVPVKVTIRYQPADPQVTLQGDDGTEIDGQLSESGSLSRIRQSDVNFVIPSLPAGESRTYRLDLPTTPSSVRRPPPEQPVENIAGQFTWHDTPGEQSELRFGDRSVLRYIHHTYDGTSKESHEKTKKVFHHLFDPATGEQLLTKGPGGLYSHHRGVFYGFSQLRYGDGQTADIWHCHNGESQRHVQFFRVEAGPIFGRHQMQIAWHGTDGQVFANEGRAVSVFNVPGGTLLEFASRLVSTDGPLVIDGDPQHAGFQFRAAQEVAESTKGETYYLRPDGRDQPGKTRNWDIKNTGQESNRQTENLLWNAMSFVVGDKRYTALYLDHPDNPKPARYSERDYGRFGSYFEKTLDSASEQPENRSLDVRYRLWIQEGEMTVEEAASMSAAFVEPPKVSAQLNRAEE